MCNIEILGSKKILFNSCHGKNISFLCNDKKASHAILISNYGVSTKCTNFRFKLFRKFKLVNSEEKCNYYRLKPEYMVTMIFHASEKKNNKKPEFPYDELNHYILFIIS